jgi:plasmid stabilization system protein ParE
MRRWLIGLEAAIREKFAFLARTPGAGHARGDLTPENVKFFPVYSYLVVYHSETKPLQIISILHGRRDVEGILKDRL